MCNHRFRICRIEFLLVAVWMTALVRVESLEAQILVKMRGEEVYGAITKDKVAWFVTEEGLLYIYEDQHRMAVIPPADARERKLFCIADVDGWIWVGSESGIFQVKDSVYSQVSLGDINHHSVHFILSEESGVWFGAERSLFFKDNTSNTAAPFPLPEDDASILIYMDRIDGQLWAGTDENLYLWRDGRLNPVANTPIGSIVEVVPQGDRYYLRTFHGQQLFRYPDSIDPLNPFVDNRVIDIEAMENGEVWLSVNGRLMTIEVNEGTLDRGITADGIRTIVEGGGFQWLIGEKAIYIRETGADEKPFRILTENLGNLEVRAVHSSDRAVWLWGFSGLYRFYRDVNIQIELNVKEDDKRISDEEGIWIKNVGYDRDQHDPFPPDMERDFQVQIDSNRKYLRNIIFHFTNGSGFRDIGDVVRDIDPISVKPGNIDLSVKVWDGYGNTVLKSYGVIEIEREPLAPWLDLTRKVVASVIGVVILAKFLASTLDGLWAILLSWAVRSSRYFDIRCRMRLFFSLVQFSEKIPVVGLLVVPMLDSMHSMLNGIYREQHCPGAATLISNNVLRQLGHPGSIVQSSYVARARFHPNVSLDDLKDTVTCHLGRNFLDKIPVAVCLENIGSIRWNEIKAEVVESLHSSLVYSDEGFCQEYLSWGSFVFIFSVSSSQSKAVIDQLHAFFDLYHKGRNFMVILVK